MTARTHPDDPKFVTQSEREVWELLRATLPDGSVLLANVRIIDEAKDHEADMVALIPDRGVVVIEVKGGSVWFGPTADGTGGDPAWWCRSRNHDRRIDPVGQVTKSKYALRDYVERDPRWTVSRIAWAHAVVTPYSSFGSDFETPDCPRWSLHDTVDLADLAGRLETNADRARHGSRLPTVSDLELVSEILHGRGFTTYDRNAEAAERQATADRLTAEQATLLHVTRLLHRVEVRGGAGSGKTVLALAQARQLSAGRAGLDRLDLREPQRVALLCYSIGLAEYFKRQVATWPKRQRPAYVGTYEDLGHLWGAPSGSRDDSEFWERQLPERMAELAADLPETEKFDAFIVDEAQDFADLWWTPLLRALRDEEQGGLFLYSDENQRIFARFGQPPVPLVPLVLDHNLRNTRQIHEVFGPLAPTRMTARGGDGVEVSFVPADGDAVSVADDAIEVLLESGWHPGNIALLTTGSRHPEHVSRTDHYGQQGYWRTYWDDDVFYGHVLGCKGLERPAVVLCVNESEARERSKERLYVGMSRATDHLIVVGQPDVVREIGGPTVAARLGI